MEILQGQVTRIKYHNIENGYSVMDVAAGKVFSDTIVGYVPQIREGDKIRAEGSWTTHSKFGPQFKAEFIEVAPPDDDAGIIAFLTTMVKGIGETKAKLIVKKFGKDTIKILDSHPERLKEIPGIGEGRFNAISTSWQANREMRETMIYLQKYGITPGYACKVWKAYGNKTKSLLQENPYRITEIWGIGFKVADGIALKLGIPKESPARVKAGIQYALNNAAEVDGHVFLLAHELAGKVAELLGVQGIDLSPYIETLAKERKLIIEGDGAIYLPAFFNAERGSAEHLIRIATKSVVMVDIDPDQFIAGYELQKEIRFSEEQTRAVRLATSNDYGCIVITGLPGTGKTSVSRVLLDLFDASDISYCLCAPTGKAAERLSTVTGREAFTIHRALGFKGEFYEFNRNYPLPYDVILVDEFSMVDLQLFYRLTEAVASGSRLILIGDTAQLPSVGAGTVLADIISSGCVPVVSLKKIFRQADASPIVLNAHRINAGERIEFGGDFAFIEAENNDIPNKLKNLVPGLIKQYGEVTVLSPMHKGESGVGRINEALQETLNPSSGQGQLERGFLKLREGDRVIQLRNNYNKDIFNGMTGQVISIDSEADKVYVDFGGRMVEYDFDEADELKLAYAISVHKSQGSEFRCVVLCFTTSHYIMLNRKLLYTAVTRAREKCILIGDKKAILIAIRSTTVKPRNTKLAETLRKEYSTLPNL